jgi:DNA-binding NarL/FixJ family response regulator
MGQTNAAAEPLRAAHAIATSIGASLLVAGIEGLARRLRIDMTTAAPASPEVAQAASDPAAAPTAAAPPAPPADPFGLTAREREVLGLVAAGYTNQRIADTLFVSPSTAGVHVSNVLGKLGVRSRTEAAAIAVRLGLDRTPGP